LRRNVLNRLDEWFPFFTSKQEDFYDMLLSNTDTIDVRADYDQIARISFRLNPDEKLNVRIVFSFFEWLGAIGGTSFFLNSIISDILGGYLYFSMLIEIMMPLYSRAPRQDSDGNRLPFKDQPDGLLETRVDFTNF